MRLGILLGWIVMTSTKLNVLLPSLKLPVLPWKQAFLRQWNPPVLDHDSHQAITECVFFGGVKIHLCSSWLHWLPKQKVPYLWAGGPTKQVNTFLQWFGYLSLEEICRLQNPLRNIWFTDPKPPRFGGIFCWRNLPLWILLLIMLLHHLSQCGHKSLAWCG